MRTKSTVSICALVAVGAALSSAGCVRSNYASKISAEQNQVARMFEKDGTFSVEDYARLTVISTAVRKGDVIPDNDVDFLVNLTKKPSTHQETTDAHVLVVLGSMRQMSDHQKNLVYDTALGVLKSPLPSDANHIRTQYAINVLGKIGKKEALQSIKPFVVDADEDTRFVASRAVRQIEGGG